MSIIMIMITFRTNSYSFENWWDVRQIIINRISVRGSVRPSVRPYVRLSVRYHSRKNTEKRPKQPKNMYNVYFYV